MANYLAIAAVAKTLLKLLEDNCPQHEFTGAAKFSLYSAHHANTDEIKEGFSLMVYRVTVNTTVRNQPARRTPDGRKRRPALPVDLSIMLTPWSTEPERQLRLLGWAMRFIEDNTVIPASVLNQSLSQSDLAAFGPDEAIEIFSDAPVLADYLGLWDKFRERWQTSVTFGVRMVNIESDITTDEGPLVTQRELRVGQLRQEGPR